MDIIFLLVIVVVMGGLMWWQSRKAKQQQQQRKDFRSNLQPGTEIITIGGVIGKVVSVDTQYEEIVIDSEGSLMRFTFNAISKEYVRPAFVSDDEVDEQGNPVSQDASEDAQAAIEPSTATDSDSDQDAGKATDGDAAPADAAAAAK